MTMTHRSGPGLGDRAGQGLPAIFWRLWTAILVNRAAGFVLPFLVLYLTTDRGLSPSVAGALAGGYGAGVWVSGLLGGLVADRFPRRTVILTGYFCAAAALVLLALADHLWTIAAAVLAVGVTADLARPALQALVADVVPAQLRVRAYSLSFWAVNLGFSVATLTAGQLTRWGYPILFLIDATSTVIAGLLLLRGLPRTTKSSAGTTHRRGFVRAVLRDRGLLVLTLAATAYALVYQQAYSTLPLVLAGQGIGPSGYGTIIAINGIVIVLLQPLVTRLVEDRSLPLTYAAGLLLVGAGFGATAFADNVLTHALVVAIWSLGEVLSAAVIAAMFIARAAPAHRGRMMALFGMTFSIGMALGPVLGTRVLEVLGPGWVWGSSAGLLTIAALGVALVLPHKSDLTQPTQELS